MVCSEVIISVVRITEPFSRVIVLVCDVIKFWVEGIKAVDMAIAPVLDVLTLLETVSASLLFVRLRIIYLVEDDFDAELAMPAATAPSITVRQTMPHVIQKTLCPNPQILFGSSDGGTQVLLFPAKGMANSSP